MSDASRANLREFYGLNPPGDGDIQMVFFFDEEYEVQVRFPAKIRLSNALNRRRSGRDQGVLIEIDNYRRVCGTKPRWRRIQPLNPETGVNNGPTI